MTKEALKLALEGGGLYEITGRIEDIDKCIVHRSVVKEALAQPEQDEVGTGCECPNCANGMGMCHTEEAQPEQEPVPNEIGAVGFQEWWDAVADDYEVEHFKPMRRAWYAALDYEAPQRKPMTDEQIRKLWAQHAAKQNGWPNDTTPPMLDIGNGSRFQAHWHESEYQVFKAGFEAAHGIKGDA